MITDRATTEQLLAKPKLSIAEISQLIADSLSTLPSVRSVAVAEDEVAVDLAGGKRIAVQAFPMVSAMNQNSASRRAALDSLMLKCA